MSSIIKPGVRVLYMKVGTHADEPLDKIFARKMKEIEAEGVAFWGYGGSTCHPVTMVQPFAKSFEEQGGSIYLCMQPMESRHFAPSVRAEEFSVDGIKWQPISPAINVTGSRYALIIKNLHKEEFELPLTRTRVALGNNMGAVGSKYIRGRVDKACLEVTGSAPGGEGNEVLVDIGLVAELVKPYAVFVRNLAK
ncbi:MAG: hypothetical protein WCC92_04955 [Candidatus Korobacteraceae bacterium]